MRKLLASLLFLACANLAHAAQGTIQVGPVVTGSAIGAGVNFAGQASALYVQPSASMQFTAPWSISVDVKSSVSTAVTSMNYYTVNDAQVRINNNGGDIGNILQTALYPGAASAPLNCSGGSRACTRLTWINDGGMHNVTLTFNGTTQRFVIDGGVAFDQTGPTSPGINTGISTIGNALSAFTLYDMRVYPRVLAPFETQQLTNLAKQNLSPNSGPLSTGMIAHWQLNGCSPTCPDTSGNNNTASFDTTGPVVAVTVPAPAFVMTGASVTLTATATDAVSGVANVQLLVDGSNAGPLLTVGPYTTTLDSTTLTDGPHTITAIGIDNAGNATTSATVNVTSNNGVVAQNYFFDPVAGSDANNCTSSITACQTSTKFNAITYHEDDIINFNKGTTSTGCWVLRQSNVLARRTHPLVMQGYGSGARPILTPNCSGTNWYNSYAATLEVGGFDGFVLNGIDFTGDATGNALSCIHVNNPTPNGFGYYTLENITFAGGCWNNKTGPFGVVFGNGNIAVDGTCVSCGSWGQQGGHIHHLTAMNIDCHGTSGPTSHDQGCITGFSNGSLVSWDLIQGVLAYNMGGISGGPAGLNGTGIFAGGYYPQAAYNVIQYFLIHDNGANNPSYCGSNYAVWTLAAQTVLVQFGEVYHNRQVLGCDSGGYDFDNGTANSIGQYLYTHDNSGPGYNNFSGAFNGINWTTNTWRYGIGEDDAVDQSNEFDISSNSAGPVYVYNMLFNQVGGNARANNAVAGMTGSPATGSIFANNILIGTQGSGVAQFVFATVNVPNVTFKNNGYWCTNCANSTQYFSRYNNTPLRMDNGAWQAAVLGGDANAIINVNPTFTGAIGQNLTCAASGTVIPVSGPQPCPAAYVLAGGSTYKAPAGIDLTASPYLLNVGTRDYYGVAIPCGGTGYPIGPSC